MGRPLLRELPLSDVYDTVEILGLDNPKGVSISAICRSLYPDQSASSYYRDKYMLVHRSCNWLQLQNHVVNLNYGEKAGTPRRLIVNQANPFKNKKSKAAVQPKLSNHAPKPQPICPNQKNITDLTEAIKDLTELLRTQPAKRGWFR